MEHLLDTMHSTLKKHLIGTMHVYKNACHLFVQYFDVFAICDINL